MRRRRNLHYGVIRPLLDLVQNQPGLSLTDLLTCDGILGDRFFDLIEIAEGPALFLEIIPAHEASDQRVLEELILSAQYWRNAAGKA